MGGAPAVGEPVPTRGVARVRGDCRGRCRGDILGNCSYSRTGNGGRDGGGVPWLGGQLIIIRIGFVLYYHQLAVCGISVLSSCLGVSFKFVSRRNGGKDREREEN